VGLVLGTGRGGIEPSQVDAGAGVAVAVGVVVGAGTGAGAGVASRVAVEAACSSHPTKRVPSETTNATRIVRRIEQSDTTDLE
jgi:hypothetical protein